jgi:hypothetical protein
MDRQLLVVTAVVGAIMLVAGAVWLMVESSGDVARLVAVFVIAGVAVCVGLWSGMRRQRQMWRTLRFDVTDDSVTRRHLNTAGLTINRGDVRSMTRTAHGLAVRGRSMDALIFIPSSVESFEQVMATLGGWGAIKEDAGRPLFRIAWLFLYCLAPLGLFLIVLRSNNPRLVIPAGCVVIAVLAACLVLIQRNRQLDQRARLMSWLIVPGPLLGVVWKMLAVIFLSGG